MGFPPNFSSARVSAGALIFSGTSETAVIFVTSNRRRRRTPNRTQTVRRPNIAQKKHERPQTASISSTFAEIHANQLPVQARP